MINSVVINGLILLFLLLSVIESQLQPSFTQHKLLHKKISPLLGLLLLLVGMGLVLMFILYGPATVVNLYMKTSFSLLLLGHAIWLGLSFRSGIRFLFWIAAVGIIGARILFPSPLNHNVFIFTSLLWFGPFFARLQLLTQKRFVIISLLWFLYDIVFVWLTPLAEKVTAVTQVTLGFPLSIGIGEQFIGSADLLWANCLISILTTMKSRWVGVTALMISHISLSVYAEFTQNLSFFPLLVLWVPVGIIVLFGERVVKKIRK